MGFLLRVRIERGKSLVREGAASVGNVAAALGFADQSHFTRTFKRLVGVPPSEYKTGAPALRSHKIAAATASQGSF
jgi:AraC family transcriptional regulator